MDAVNGLFGNKPSYFQKAKQDLYGLYNAASGQLFGSPKMSRRRITLLVGFGIAIAAAIVYSRFQKAPRPIPKTLAELGFNSTKAPLPRFKAKYKLPQH